ncbi:unnamed protein product [Ambrosiozyma monospora]|uniref:Unnamed protein product n=1 Tax=Ambrosiozyma monospora TaxID=43982 RepID=A0ACB5TBV3_AMBMO|nr:unnamed protein product [Ambrosiozyma monospora]
MSIVQSTHLAVRAVATSTGSLALPALASAARRSFAHSVSPVLFEKESKTQAPQQNITSSGTFNTFKQYRLKIVQQDPLTLQTRRQFLPRINGVEQDVSESLKESEEFKAKASKY